MAMNKHSDEEVNVLYKKIQEDILDLLNSYFKGEKVIDSRSKIKKFFSNSLSKVMDKALMPIFAKKFFVVDNGKCNQCQVCVEQCPANNIEIIDTDITFKKQCLRCSKCIHICPQNAYIFNGKSIEQLDIKQSSILEQIQ